MAITQEELERRIKELASRAGRNPQGSATTGLSRRNIVNIEDLDPRDINPGLGLQRPTPDESQDFSEIPEDEASPLPRESEADVGDLGTIGDAPAPEGEGVGLDVMSPTIAPFALSVIANAFGIPIPPTNPYALIKVVRNALSMEDDPTMTEDEAFEDINTEIDAITQPEVYSEFSTNTALDPDVNPETYSEFSIEGEGGGSSGGNVGPGADQGSPLGGGGQEGDMGEVGEGGDGK